jgi:PBP1b-binding outer membrane lipoprotein LpoB
MKKTFLLLSLGAVLFISCKKSTSTPTITDPNPVSITGKWTYVKDSVNFYKNGQFSSMQVENYTNEHMLFNNDGTGNNDETSFTYKLTNKTLSLNFAAYTAGGIQHAADQGTATILALSDHKLYFYYDNIATGNNSVYTTLSR